MNGVQDFSDHRQRYGRPISDRIVAELVESGDALAAQLQTLKANPTPDGAERVACQLHGMHRSAGQLVTVLAREMAE